MWEGAITLFPGVTSRIIWNKKGGLKEIFRIISEVRKSRFDLVFDLQGLFRTAVVAFFSGAPVNIGVPGMKEFGWLLVREAYPQSRSLHAVQRCLEAVRWLTGRKYDAKFDLAVPSGADSDAGNMIKDAGFGGDVVLLGIVPHARGRAKNWPDEHYIKLLDLLKTLQKKVVAVILGSKESAGRFLGKDILDLCGRTSIVQLAAVLKRCSAVVGGDTGPVHIAAALGVQTLTLFGGSDINETSPLGPGAVNLTRNYPCSPCRARPVCRDFRCLSEIRPEEVFEEIRKKIKA